MTNIFISAAAFAATFSFLVLVKVSDGASVSVLTTTDVALATEESLSSSFSASVHKTGTNNGKVLKQEKKVLSQFMRESTNVSSPINDDDINGYISSQVVNQNGKNVEKATTTATRKPQNSKDISNITVTKILKNNINTVSNTSWSSPLYVARCRATCIEKFQTSTSESVMATTATNAESQDEFISTTTEFQHLARLRAKLSPNHVLKSKFWSCVESSSDCSSCWRNCELLDIPKTDGDFGKAAKTKQDPKQVNPVVATKHQYSLKITPGKLSWPAFLSSSPVVYVVIQEYPDRNWRQLAQTTQTEIAVHNDPTSSEANSMNLNSARVLVVDKSGLRLVYNPVIAHKSQQARNSTDNLPINPLNGSLINATKSRASAASPATTNETIASFHSAPNKKNPCELRVISLIHQKSLAIAELRWNAAGDNPDQDYLITWKLSGGGLKGHLVTDSTSVTLSLWPDTSYTIQVETFEQRRLNVDGDEPSVEGMRCLPLKVDTREASFTLAQPSAFLLGMDTEDENEQYENERNLSVSRGQDEKVSVALGRTQPMTHDSASLPVHHFTGLLNVTLMMGFAISALLFILVVLLVTAFTWTRMRAMDSFPQWRPNSPANLDECSRSPILSPARNQNEGKYPMNYAHDNTAWVEDCHYPWRHKGCGAHFGPGEVFSHCPCRVKNSAAGIFGEMFEYQRDSSVAVIGLNDKREMLAPLIRPTFSAEVPPYLVFSGERENPDSLSCSRLEEGLCTFPRESVYH